MSSAIPESLRRVLASMGKPDQPASPVQPFKRPEQRGDITTCWRDGECYREYANGKFKRLPSISPISSQ